MDLTVCPSWHFREFALGTISVVEAAQVNRVSSDRFVGGLLIVGLLAAEALWWKAYFAFLDGDEVVDWSLHPAVYLPRLLLDIVVAVGVAKSQRWAFALFVLVSLNWLMSLVLSEGMKAKDPTVYGQTAFFALALIYCAFRAFEVDGRHLKRWFAIELDDE